MTGDVTLVQGSSEIKSERTCLRASVFSLIFVSVCSEGAHADDWARYVTGVFW